MHECFMKYYKLHQISNHYSSQYINNSAIENTKLYDLELKVSKY